MHEGWDLPSEACFVPEAKHISNNTSAAFIFDLHLVASIEARIEHVLQNHAHDHQPNRYTHAHMYTFKNAHTCARTTLPQTDADIHIHSHDAGISQQHDKQAGGQLLAVKGLTTPAGHPPWPPRTGQLHHIDRVRDICGHLDII